MGGYLGRARSHRRSLAVPTGDLQKRPSPPVHGVSPSIRVNSMDRCLNMADSLSLEDDEALANSQEHPGRVVDVHTQRYPVEKARDLLVAVFSSMFLIGQHNSVPTLSGSRMSRSSMILKVVFTKGRATLGFVLGQPVLIIWSFLTGYFSTQSRKETRVSALQETSKSKSKRMRATKKEDPTTSGKGGEGFAKQEEGSPVIKRPSDQGKDSGGGVSAPSAFTRLIVNGVLSSFIPRPGPLGMDICSKNSAKSCNKESHITFKSSYKRNAIASSYSSSLAQWPPERIRVLTSGCAGPGAISGAALGTAAGATRGAAPEDTADATRAAAPGVVSGAALGTAAHATRGATADAAAGATPSAASKASADGASEAATDDASGAVPGAAPGAAGDAASGATPDAASGATADDASGPATDTASGALSPPSSDSPQLKEAANKGDDEKDSASSGNSKKKEKKTKKEKKKERKEKKEKIKKAKQAAAIDTPQVKQGNRRKGLPKSDIPKPVRRKIPLLLPHRGEVPLIPPPPPGLCFQITAEDFDLEKKTAMQWINKVLKDDGAKARRN